MLIKVATLMNNNYEKIINELKEVCDRQAGIESFWLLNPRIGEYLFMAALRHLHAIVEEDEEAAERAKKKYWNVEEDL